MNMTRVRRTLLATVTGLLLVSLAGCIEREERITIAADGSVTVVHILKGDLPDLKGGAAAVPAHGYEVKSYALPQRDYRKSVYARLKKLGHPELDPLLPEIARALKAPGGDVKRHAALFAKLKEIGDPEVQRALPELWKVLKQPQEKSPRQYGHKATASYPSVEEMPTSFEEAAGKTFAQALRWQDRVESRKENGRSVHVFTRTYEARRWGRFAFGEKRWIAGLFPDLMRWSGLTEARKLEVVRDLLAFERFKHEEFVGAALRQVAPGHPRTVEAVLAAREALAARAPDAEEILGLLRLPDSELKTETGTLLTGLEGAAIESAARTLSMDEAAKSRLRRAYQDARWDFEVTDDLSDETFLIRLTLPGKVLRHNGDDLTGMTVTWKFSGKDLRDRDHDLAAVWVID